MNNRKINTENKKVQKNLNNFINQKTKEFKMKAIKVISGVLTILLISVLIGCSDNFIAPANSSVSEYLQSTENHQTDEAIVPKDAKYKLNFKIQPNEVMTLDSKVTDLTGIKSFSISNCNIERKDLFVSASNLDQSGSLGCSWNSNSSFMLNDLIIENRSGKVREIEVVLSGRSIKKY